MAKSWVSTIVILFFLSSFVNKIPVNEETKILKQSTYHIEAVQTIKSLTGTSDISYVSTGRFIYNPKIIVERYKAGDYLYEVSVDTKQVLHFEPILDNNFSNFPSYKMDREIYKVKALELIKKFDPNSNLDQLSSKPMFDDGYFRWEDITKSKFPNGQYPSIQVVFAPDGRIFSYTNTIYPNSTNMTFTNGPMITPTTLAAPGAYFSRSGSPWYLHSGGGYGGSDFYYAPGGGNQVGTWQYFIGGSIATVYAYIPNVSGTFASNAWYNTYYNNGYVLTVMCNQQLRKNGYCNPANNISNFQKEVLATNNVSSSEYVVYDELFFN